MLPVASDRYRMYGILVCRINQVMEGTTAGRSERCAHGCCNPSGGGTYFIMLFQNWGMLFVQAAFVTDSSSIKGLSGQYATATAG